tara:strand:- start:178 stop:630 length:453 start_codon:yes stop_codon:yes gene_type:complete
MNNKIFKFICSGFGIGYIPIFPGTIASFVILFPVWFFKDNFDKAYLILLILILLFLSERLISKIIKYEENKDPKFIVIDEFIGQASALVFCNQLIFDYILAFIGFRVLDIFKPFPVNYFDKIKNSYGVLLDDLVAGSIIAIFFLIYYETF